ncbi:TlpA disulfide reductase family protein [Soonwooa sp.]|uniref:peroxiredoxin family protein n=1 Tax=Soonwooa sp. TaxID=1938592 RepID=UPI00261CA98B|nr:TlpA disulfide reductase family protein [Soonwooa sp.]
MRNTLLALCVLGASSISAQFKVNANVPSNFQVDDAYIFGYDGSNDVLLGKGTKKGNSVNVSIPKSYKGMLRMVFFPSNSSIQMASENQDINLTVGKVEGKTIKEVAFQDAVNKYFESSQNGQKKKELIYPALLQIKDYYSPSDAFYPALEKEIALLSSSTDSKGDYPFVNYYSATAAKYVNNPDYKNIPLQDYIDFFGKTGNYLETSSLMKPILISYLNTAGKESVSTDIEKLLKSVDIETPRGQTVLSELIEIFDTYGMNDLKDKYLKEAKELKCTINDRLSGTIKSQDEIQIGAKFQDSKLYNTYNTKAKSIYDVKADRKVIIVWASTCSHCTAELPKIIEKYPALKAKKVEIIGLSLDTDLKSYGDLASKFPWISASDGKGWYSDYAKNYNVHATPTYFILDSSDKIVAKPDRLSDVFEYFNLK